MLDVRRFLTHFNRMNETGPREFNVVVERDEDGLFVASVPGLPGCHTQAPTMEELRVRVKEAIELCLEAQSDAPGQTEFVGIEQVRL